MNLKIFLLIGLLSLAAVAQTNKTPMRSKTEPIRIGEIAPDFTLNDQNGKAVKLSKIKKNVMLVFYRGYW